MSDIKIGDRVVCVDDWGYNNLIKGREYIVYDIKRQDCCNDLVFDIGLQANSNEIICGHCQKISHITTNPYYMAKRFKKVEEKINYVRLEIAIQEPILN